MAQLVQKVEGAAQKGYISTNGLSTGQARNGLAYHSLKDTGGNVLTASTFINEGLHVSFGKYTTAGGDRIDGGSTLGHFV